MLSWSCVHGGSREEGELALFSRLAEWIGCFVMGYPCSVSSRHVLKESDGAIRLISVELAIIIPEQCAEEDEMNDA